MKKCLEKIKRGVLGQGTYGLLAEGALPPGPFREVYVPGARGRRFMVTSDTSSLAKNHCGATAATNLALVYLEGAQPGPLFLAFHQKIGNGPVIFMERKIQAVFRDLGQPLHYQRTRDPKRILAGLQEGTPAILLLARGLLAWHYVLALGYRVYPRGEVYLMVHDGWHREALRFYQLNQGSLLLGASLYKRTPAPRA
ncbi:MAG: hypothetical protein Q4E37_04260 [Tissierellia bacterium]|nr:hypothetical protein [Tissierellia bacterium]